MTCSAACPGCLVSWRNHVWLYGEIMLCYEEKTAFVENLSLFWEGGHCVKEKITQVLEGNNHTYKEIIRQMLQELLEAAICEWYKIMNI